MPLRSLFGGGVDWQLELERERVLPGTLVRGRVTITPRDRLEARGCIASLIATEQWKYQETERDAKGNTRTVTRTATAELRRLPVQLLGPTVFDAGQATTREFEVPVPPMGPPTFAGDVSRLTWDLEVKLDKSGIDPSIVSPVIVLQPRSLLAAGAVNTGQWGLWEQVEGALGEVPYRLALEPVPLCVGMPFTGSLELGRAIGGRVRSVRVELKVSAQATVGGGLSEEHTLFSAPLAGGGLPAGTHGFGGTVAEQWLPSVDLPHGRGRARLDIVLDRAFAPDQHIVRDVALASTTEM
jgi:hypothetical protein